jgi:hypothetical protein
LFDSNLLLVIGSRLRPSHPDADCPYLIQSEQRGRKDTRSVKIPSRHHERT